MSVQDLAAQQPGLAGEPRLDPDTFETPDPGEGSPLQSSSEQLPSPVSFPLTAASRRPSPRTPIVEPLTPGTGHLGGPTRRSSSNCDAAWRACSGAARDYDEKLIQSWRMDMDTTLVFAALFSAILTAFLLESYQWLSEDPQDVAVSLLARIVVQLESAGSDSSSSPLGSFAPTTSHVAINALWFASLVMTLQTTLMAILVKQWLTEYVWTTGSKVTSPHQTATLRAFRFSGLTAWRIPQIIQYLPCQLILALFLFLSGLVVLLWDYDAAVALPSTLLVVGSALYFIGTSILPALYPACGYKSAQAWLVYRLTRLGGAIYLARTGRTSRRASRYAPRGWVDAALQYLAQQQNHTRFDAAQLRWIHYSLTSWDPSLSHEVWKCAVSQPVQVFHALVRELADTETANGQLRHSSFDVEEYRMDVRLASDVDVQEHITAAVQSLINKRCQDEYSEKRNFVFSAYNLYLNALLQFDSVRENMPIAEYMAALHFFQFYILDDHKFRREADIVDPLLQGTCLWTMFLNESEDIGEHIKQQLGPLQTQISNVLTKFSMLDWRFADCRNITDGTPAFCAISSYINATLSRSTTTALDSDVFVSLVESTLLMSRRVRKAGGMTEQLKRLLVRMQEFVHLLGGSKSAESKRIRIAVVERWLPLLEREGEMSVVKEWDLDEELESALVSFAGEIQLQSQVEGARQTPRGEADD